MTEPTERPHAIGRRALLAGAGLGALGAAGTLGAGAAAAGPVRRRATAADPADLPLTGGPDFPIGIFWPPPPFEVTAARYREIAAAGITFLITGNYMFDQFINRRALDLAGQTGLRVLVGSPEPRLSATTTVQSVGDDAQPLTIGRADATLLVQQLLADYTPYPAFAGFDVYDEPAPAKFPTVAAVTDVVREQAPALLPYSNLVPGNGDAYASFVHDFVTQVRPPVLSFDRYPILPGGADVNYFDNWAIVRREALAAGIPAWTYLQSVKYANHALPTAADVRWQVNVSLAYGAKGILWFTYWTPDPARGEGFESAMLSVDGRRTATYDHVRDVNRSWLKPVGRELKPLVSESVQHANDTPLPPGTEAFAPGRYVAAVSGGALVLGLFRAATDDGTRWLLAANRSEKKRVRATITPGSAVGGVARFRPGSGTYAAPRKGTVDVDLTAGSAVLLKLVPA